MSERLFLSSGNLTILETSSTSDSGNGNTAKKTLLVSVLDHENLNKVLIGSEEGKKYYETLVNKPVQAYLKYDVDGKPDNFGGHELRAKKDADGEILYYFATQSIGTHTKAWIENIYLEEYGGNVDCILAEVELWTSRYPEYYEVAEKLIESGGLDMSWEIDTQKYEYTKGKKRLLEFEFIGNCMLGSDVTPAVTGAGVMTSEVDNRLRRAIEKDIMVSESVVEIEKEDYSLENEDKKVIDNAEEVEKVEEVVVFDEKKEEEILENEVVNGEITEDQDTENAEVVEEPVAETTVEVSSLTQWDIYKRVYEALSQDEEKLKELGLDYAWDLDLMTAYPAESRMIYSFYGKDKESSMIEVKYSVGEDDNVTILEFKKVEMIFVEVSSVEEKDTKIVELSEKLVELNTELSEKENSLVELSEYKTKLEEIQVAELEAKKLADIAEMKEKYLATRMIAEEEFETDEVISLALSELDEPKLKMVIADRIIEGRKPFAIKPNVAAKKTVEVSEEAKAEETKLDISSYLGFKSKPNGGSLSGFLYND